MKDKTPDQRILESWKTNAEPWINAIRENQIESRVRLTNKAVLEQILSYRPASVIVIGCGEGWLCRALESNGVSTLGVDATADLITSARGLSASRFECVSYDQIVAGAIRESFDLAVFNFSLFGNESVESLIKSVPAFLNPNGNIVVQTLHPATSIGGIEQDDGWRESSWQGFSDEFRDPAPWYYRSTRSWFSMLARSGFREINTLQPSEPNKDPVSIIFSAAI